MEAGREETETILEEKVGKNWMKGIKRKIKEMWGRSVRRENTAKRTRKKNKQKIEKKSDKAKCFDRKAGDAPKIGVFSIW